MNKIGLLLLPVLAFFAQPFAAFAQDSRSLRGLPQGLHDRAAGGKNGAREPAQARALAKLRFAGSLLEELKKNSGDWQPAIVDYRSRKIGEAILRVQSKISTQTDLSDGAAAGAPKPASLPLPSAAPAWSPASRSAPGRPPPRPVDVQSRDPGCDQGAARPRRSARGRAEKIAANRSTPRKRKSPEISGKLRADQRRARAGQRRAREKSPGRDRSPRPALGRAGIARRSFNRPAARRPEGGARAAGRRSAS